MRFALALASLLCAAPALAGRAAPRTLPFDEGQAGVEQRSGKAKDVLSVREAHGGRVARIDRYQAKDGVLRLVKTVVSGRYAGGSLLNIHDYVPRGERSTLAQMDQQGARAEMMVQSSISARNKLVGHSRLGMSDALIITTYPGEQGVIRSPK